MKLLVDIISIHRKEEGEAHRDFQVHTAKIGKDRIPTLVCLITNLMLSLGDLPNPGTEPRSPALQVNSLPHEPLGNPKKTGLGSQPLLQGNLPDLGMQPGSPALQLSYQGNPSEHWSGLSRPPPGDLPNPGIKPVSLTSPALSSRFFTIIATWETSV